MKVLLVSHRYPPDGIGGVERYTQALASELVKAGDAVSIITRRPAESPALPQIVHERLLDGTSLYRFVGGGFGYQFLAHHQRLEQLFSRIMIETVPDVVHINHLWGLSPRFIEIAHRHGAAVVLSLHDFYFACPLVHLQKRSGELCEGPDGGQECARTCFAEEGAEASLRWGLRTAYFRRLLALADSIICPSRYVASYVEQFGTDPLRISVVPNGALIAADRLPQLDFTAKERATLNLAFMGQVSSHKGVHVILEALSLAGLNSIELAILGPVEDKEYARKLREQAAGISGLRFRMYGGYNLAELSYLLNGVDCVITPSQVPESFSITTREALAQGIPVVVARLGALPEAVNEGKNGFTFDPNRPEELAEILKQIAGNDSLLRRLREGAQMTPIVIISEHTEIIRTKHKEAVEEMLRGSGARSGDTAEAEFLHRSLINVGFAGQG